MNMQLTSSKNLELKKQTVNKAVRICVNCGSISVHIENYGVFCKECGIFFDIKENEKWLETPVEVFVGIMMPILHLEIPK